MKTRFEPPRHLAAPYRFSKPISLKSWRCKGKTGFEPPRHLAAPYRFSKPISLKSWRWEGDSNPRGTLRHPTGLANPPLQPLEYPTVVLLSWRRDWDSNPGWLTPRRFSRPLHSTTLPSLHHKQNKHSLHPMDGSVNIVWKRCSLSKDFTYFV